MSNETNSSGPSCARCAACGDEVKHVTKGLRVVMCAPCELDYHSSPEAADASMSRDRFVARRRQELGR